MPYKRRNKDLGRKKWDKRNESPRGDSQAIWLENRV